VDTMMAILCPRRTYFLRFESAVLCRRWLELLRDLLGYGHVGRRPSLATDAAKQEAAADHGGIAQVTGPVEGVRRGLAAMVKEEARPNVGGGVDVEEATRIREVARLQRLSPEARHFAVPLGLADYDKSFRARLYHAVGFGMAEESHKEDWGH